MPPLFCSNSMSNPFSFSPNFKELTEFLFGDPVNPKLIHFVHKLSVWIEINKEVNIHYKHKWNSYKSALLIQLDPVSCQHKSLPVTMVMPNLISTIKIFFWTLGIILMSKPGSNCRCFVVTTIWVSWDHTSQKECQASLKRNGVHHDFKLFLLRWCYHIFRVGKGYKF